MTRSTFLGEFEQLVLLALARLGDEAYGVAIRGEIERRVSFLNDVTVRRRVTLGSDDSWMTQTETLPPAKKTRY